MADFGTRAKSEAARAARRGKRSKYTYRYGTAFNTGNRLLTDRELDTWYASLKAHIDRARTHGNLNLKHALHGTAHSPGPLTGRRG